MRRKEAKGPGIVAVATEDSAPDVSDVAAVPHNGQAKQALIQNNADTNAVTYRGDFIAGIPHIPRDSRLFRSVECERTEGLRLISFYF